MLKPGDRAIAVESDTRHIEITVQEDGSLRLRTNDLPLSIKPEACNVILAEHTK